MADARRGGGRHRQRHGGEPAGGSSRSRWQPALLHRFIGGRASGTSDLRRPSSTTASRRFAKVADPCVSAAAVADHDERKRLHGGPRDRSGFEYPILVALATLGMMMMVSANDLMALYMGLELQSLALYVVAAINRDSALDRSGPEIFRPRRAVVGHAALRRLAGLRLHRHDRVSRHHRNRSGRR